MRHIVFLFLLTIAVVSSTAQTTPFSNYNIVWTTPSENASASMPCGGGDIGMNVWVEKGDLLIYIARSGNFDESNALMKTGRIRVRLYPNPFTGNKFKQELHLQEGYVTVNGESNGVNVSVKVWADVFNPIAHIDVSSNKKIAMTASYESWRYQDRILQSRENWGNSFKWAAPKVNLVRKDEIAFENNGVLFYHHNLPNTIFDLTVEQQGMNQVKGQLYNPLKQLAFGGYFGGSGLTASNTTDSVYVDTDYRSWNLKGKGKTFKLYLALHNDQVNDINVWKQSLNNTKKIAVGDKGAYNKTQQWWKEFWSRSFIQIDPKNSNSQAWQVGRNYQLFRYMLALNAKGTWPTKFNGGLLTVDPSYTDPKHHLTPDYRNWGGGLHTMQNQRLVYFPMIKNGDWDLLQSQLDFYLRILKNAELRSKVYWNHGGACFTEQMENYGLPNYAEYGQNRPAGFDPGLEFNAWLEYEWDTVFEFCLMMLEEQRYTNKDINDRLAFIESCLRFFDTHYQYLAKKRGIKALDGNGKLILFPGSGAETFKMAYNSSSTIAALQSVTARMLALPSTYLTTAQRGYLDSLQRRIPPIQFASINNKPVISPAQSWERIQNTESTQLYPVFPYAIYGVGMPGLDTAINTWHLDTNVIKFRSHLGWKQDNIWAARLGLTAEAWRLTSMKFANSERRFPAFWGPGFDWVPDHNWGGSGMIGLQEMLMQVDNRRILLLPSWPANIDVHFKLHAPYQTTVEVEYVSGKLTVLKVIPEERRKDVEVMVSRYG